MVLLINAVILIGIAIYARVREVSTTDDFLVAGRKIKWPVISGSIVVNWAWGSTILVAAEAAKAYGWAGLWMYILSGISLPIAGVIFVKIRKAMPKGTTLTEYVRLVFGNKVHKAAVFVTLFINIILLMYLGVGLGAGIAPVFGMSYSQAVIFCSVIIIVYTLLGGLMSTILTNYFQYIIMWIILGVITIFAFFHVGGVGGLYDKILTMNWDTGRAIFETWSFLDYGLVLIIGWFSYAIADQTMWQRAYAVGEPKDTKKTFFFGWISWSLFPMTAGLVGLVAAVLNINATQGSDLFANLIVEIAPTWLIIGWAFLIFNTIASSLSSVLVAIASIVSTDIILRIKPEKINDDKYLMKANIICIIGFGIIGIIMSLNSASVLAIGIFLSGFLIIVGTPIYISFMMKRLNGKAVLMGMIVAFVIAGTLSTAVNLGWLTSIGNTTIYIWQVYLGILIIESAIIVIGSLLFPGEMVTLEKLEEELEKEKTLAQNI